MAPLSEELNPEGLRTHACACPVDTCAAKCQGDVNAAARTQRPVVQLHTVGRKARCRAGLRARVVHLQRQDWRDWTRRAVRPEPKRAMHACAHARRGGAAAAAAARAGTLSQVSPHMWKLNEDHSCSAVREN